jgi:hypothetical protein
MAAPFARCGCWLTSFRTLSKLWLCGGGGCGGGGGGMGICPKIQVRCPCITPEFEYLSWQNLAIMSLS